MGAVFTFILTIAFAGEPARPLRERAKTDVGISWTVVREAAEDSAAAIKKLREWAAKEDPQKTLKELRDAAEAGHRICIQDTKSMASCDRIFTTDSKNIADLEKTAASFAAGAQTARANYWAFVVWRRRVEDKLLKPAEQEWARDCKSGPSKVCTELLADFTDIDDVSKKILARDRRLFGEGGEAVDAAQLKAAVKKYE